MPYDDPRRPRFRASIAQPSEATVVDDLRKSLANPDIPEGMPMTPDGHRTIGIVADVVPVVLAKSHARPDRMQQTGHPPTATWPQRLLSALLLLALLVWGSVAVHAESDSKVEAVQRALAERGYDPGDVDGAMGQRTAGALEAFQRSVGLPDTGAIDDDTWTALGLGHMTGAERGREPDAGTLWSETDASSTESLAAAPQANANRIDTETTPAGDTTHAESSRAEPAPAVREKPRLGFATLGWHPPQTGAAALARFDAIGAHPELKREKGTLFVPKGEFVFVLEAGERFPGLDCDPGAGRLSIEFVFGPDGPVIFTPTEDGEYCQAGIGIVIEVGRTLAIRRIDWGDLQLPQGTVRVTLQGLQYID